MSVAGMLIFILLLLPFVGGVVLIFFNRKRGQGYPACGKCGYDVTGTLGASSPRCPECGSEFVVVGITPPSVRSNKPAMWIGIVMMMLPVTCVGTGILLTRASYMRASQSAQAARAAAVQQQVLTQQAMWASNPADPALVATFRAKVANMTDAEASARLSAIFQELARRQADQSLTEEIAGNLRAESRAISDQLGGQPPVAPQQP